MKEPEIELLIQCQVGLLAEIEDRAEMARNFSGVMWQAILVFLTRISSNWPEVGRGSLKCSPAVLA